eukprot:Trichotokara_eunicae@DN630_c0_g1_i2.p1
MVKHDHRDIRLENVLVIEEEGKLRFRAIDYETIAPNAAGLTTYVYSGYESVIQRLRCLTLVAGIEWLAPKAEWDFHGQMLVINDQTALSRTDTLEGVIDFWKKWDLKIESVRKRFVRTAAGKEDKKRRKEKKTRKEDKKRRQEKKTRKE